MLAVPACPFFASRFFLGAEAHGYVRPAFPMEPPRERFVRDDLNGIALTVSWSGSIVIAMMLGAFSVRTAYRIEGGPNGLGGFVGFPLAR